ncbi:MAG: TadE/TadG family type IV pilus assembly protein [Methylocella sp.]
MTRTNLFTDRRGTSAVEFALTLPVFILLILGVYQIGYGMWAQFGLQHGAQMAARCMAVAAAATNPTTCNTTASIQSYAVSQSYGLSPSPSVFTVSQPTCGNQISATYTVSPAVASIGIPALTLYAQACAQR